MIEPAIDDRAGVEPADEAGEETLQAYSGPIGGTPENKWTRG